jgi:methanogenic corrinoid protein MtbC1
MSDLGKKAALFIDESRTQLVDSIFSCQLRAQPDIRERYDGQRFEHVRKDIDYHLMHLSGAIHMSSKVLFEAYVQWLKVLMHTYNLPEDDMWTNLTCMRDVLREEIPEDLRDVSIEVLEAGLDQFDSASETVPEYISGDPEFAILATKYLSTLLSWERETASKLILDAVQRGVRLRDIYLEVFAIAQKEVGRLWLQGEISVAQEHYCTAATNLIMSQLRPYILKKERNGLKVVLSCVPGELHSMGLRILSDFFEMDGWDAVYLGGNTPIKSLLQIVKRTKPDLIALSSTMTFNLNYVTEFISTLRDTDGIKDTKVIVGGAPFVTDPELWNNVGAEGCAVDAERAVALGNRLVANG